LHQTSGSQQSSDKVHRDIDAPTLEILAIEVTDDRISNASTLANLPGQISSDEDITSVSSDGAY
jgi:hypothetical protein